MRTLTGSRVLLATLSLAPLLTATASANVLVVDASGGAAYTQIQPAVDAAVDGDTILVKAGSYTWFSIMNKALAVVGDSGATVQVIGGIHVRNLDATKTVVLERLQSTGQAALSGSGQYGLYLSNDLGRVRVEHCQINGANGSLTIGDSDGYAGVYTVACPDVALLSCTATGGVGLSGIYPNVGTSGVGVLAIGSKLTIYDSSVSGGNGQSADPCHGGGQGLDGGNGGSSFYGDSVTLFASDSTFTGGNGGNAQSGCFGCSVNDEINADGGHALYLGDTPGNVAFLVANTEQGGFTGVAYGQLCSQYGPYPTTARAGHAFSDLPGPSRKMQSASPVRENTTSQVTFTGVPGEQVALLVSEDADRVLKLPWTGILLVKIHHPLLSVPMGTIPPSGSLVVPTVTLDLGGAASKVLHVQPLFIGPQGRTLGNASSTVILSHLY